MRPTNKLQYASISSSRAAATPSRAAPPSRRATVFGRGLLAAAVLASALTASPARAADMVHRLREHAAEGYLIGSLGMSVTGADGAIVGGYLLPQVGVGVMFPGTRCAGLGAWGFELAGGPALPLSSGLGFDTQLIPSLVFELPILNLQLFARGGLILQTAQIDNPGVSGQLMVGWYARPMSFRVGVGYDVFANERVFTGVRLEVLWLGEDPQHGY